MIDFLLKIFLYLIIFKRVVKRTKSEYDNTGTKNEYTMYAITDA